MDMRGSKHQAGKIGGCARQFIIRAKRRSLLPKLSKVFHKYAYAILNNL